MMPCQITDTPITDNLHRCPYCGADFAPWICGDDTVFDVYRECDETPVTMAESSVDDFHAAALEAIAIPEDSPI